MELRRSLVDFIRTSHTRSCRPLSPFAPVRHRDSTTLPFRWDPWKKSGRGMECCSCAGGGCTEGEQIATPPASARNTVVVFLELLDRPLFNCRY
jgi:hypothetical protein